ncbi:hypothetical protein [Nonomuraea antimicrobica]
MDPFPKGDAVTFPVSMTMGQWHLIDGSMDNEVSVEAVEGDRRDLVDLAGGIREAGCSRSLTGHLVHRGRAPGRPTMRS